MINPIATGKLIAKRRKEKNLTQEKLAERIGVTNKSVSKWECGKCMPDYGVIGPLCEELGVTVSELIDGKEQDNNSLRLYDDQQALDMLARIQRLEKQKQMLVGGMLIMMGTALLALSQNLGGTSFKDFVSGVAAGLSVGEMLAGIYVAGRAFIK